MLSAEWWGHSPVPMHMDTIGIPMVSRLDTQVGRKEDSKRVTSFDKNADKLSQTRINEHFQKGRDLLNKRLTGNT